MRAVILAAPCLLGLIGLSNGPLPPADQVLARAQDQFKRGVDSERQPAEARRHFGDAAKELARLSGRVRSPALCLGLGNAEALAGRWPWAIAWYHTGLKIDPNHAALRDHLAYARTLVNYPPGNRGRPAPDYWPRWLRRPTAADLFIAMTAAYALAWVAGAWWRMRRSRAALMSTLALAAIALGSATAWLLDEGQARRDDANPLLIVVADGTPLQRGNGPSYPAHPDVPSLPAGLEARRLHVRGAWMQLQLTTGEIGWVPRDAVVAVVSQRRIVQRGMLVAR